MGEEGNVDPKIRRGRREFLMLGFFGAATKALLHSLRDTCDTSFLLFSFEARYHRVIHHVHRSIPMKQHSQKFLSLCVAF